MPDIIQLLPDHVANQIAAGEVVQRPASVVKELLENSIDASSTSIQLIIRDAGKTLIQVIDNGNGMSTLDAKLSFERHATSKIRVAEDLFKLHTKGFRGEAMASIAAISHVEMKTKQNSQEIGTHIKIEGSKITYQEMTATSVGTNIAVKNLFYNIPARRNFLKSDTIETRHIIDEFQRVSLTHPEIAFSLYHNDNEVYLLKASNLRQRIVAIFGAKMNEKLVPVSEDTEMISIEGFITKPNFSKKKRGEQFFFVNDRYIKSSYLNHAVNSAFEGLLRQGTHASYFLYLEVNPKTIDINIHPTKTEIKFEDEHTLYAILRSAIKHSLGQFSIAPVLDFDRDANLDTPYNFKNRDANVPRVEVDSAFNPFQDDVKSTSKFGSSYKKDSGAHWESLYVGIESKSNSSDNFSSVEFETDEVTSSMFDEEETRKVQKTFQIQNKYIVNTIKSGVLIIDQNKAHQRILYEEYLQNITVKEGVSQQLLFPLGLTFTTDEIEILKGLKEQLEQAGFLFSKLDQKVELSGIPLSIPENIIGITLEKLINDVQNEVPDSSFSQSDMLAKSLSKSLAIKNGKRLSIPEQENLVNSLFACKEPNVTPQGQVTFITMSVDDIDKKFK